ncbi:hypothetical protein ACW9HR_21380 [Nocardia gipuzkoensis]
MTDNPHHVQDDHPNPSEPATPERPATVTPLRRPRRRHGEITVERIETTPMTPEQYQRAVTALAALVNEWKYGPDNPEQSSKKAA